MKTINETFTEEEFKFIKPALYGAIKIAILALTIDASQTEVQDSSTKALLDSIEGKKNFIGTRQKLSWFTS